MADDCTVGFLHSTVSTKVTGMKFLKYWVCLFCTQNNLCQVFWPVPFAPETADGVQVSICCFNVRFRSCTIADNCFLMACILTLYPEGVCSSLNHISPCWLAPSGYRLWSLRFSTSWTTLDHPICPYHLGPPQHSQSRIITHYNYIYIFCRCVISIQPTQKGTFPPQLFISAPLPNFSNFLLFAKWLNRTSYLDEWVCWIVYSICVMREKEFFILERDWR